MQIPAYQIHNVLKTYSLQLFRVIGASNLTNSGDYPPSQELASETRREAVIDKIAAEIVQRITRLDSLKSRSVNPPTAYSVREDEQRSEMQYNQFVFQTLDVHNNKISRSLSIEDSIFLIKRNADSEPA